MARFDLTSARAAAHDDRTAIWVGDFLASRGSDNLILAAALAQQEHFWFGPERIPLADLVRLAGPEPDVLVPVDRDVWEHDVSEMENKLDDGWEPPPLLAEYRDGRLVLQDGNHRCAALLHAGETDAWVLVYFATESERDRFAATQN